MFSAPYTYRIQLEAGEANPPEVTLTHGEQFDPVSLGRAATWHVVAEGVLDVHAFVYFDGAALYVRAAEGALVRANGEAIGARWTEIAAPCMLELQAARFRFVASQPSLEPAPTKRPFGPGAFVPPPDTERTPVNLLRETPPPPMAMMPLRPEHIPDGTVVMQVAPSASVPDRSLLGRFRALTLPQRALVVLAPLSVLSAAFLIFDAPPETSGTAIDAGVAPVPVAVQAPPPVVLAEPAAPPAPSATASASAGAVTLERQAVDWVATGNYRQAAETYEVLLRENPTSRVYAEAARILRAKLDAGAP